MNKKNRQWFAYGGQPFGAIGILSLDDVQFAQRSHGSLAPHILLQFVGGARKHICCKDEVEVGHVWDELQTKLRNTNNV